MKPERCDLRMTKPINAVMLIPSLEPDDRLPKYVETLFESGFSRVVIVDDGSSESYQPIFAQLDAMDGCTVLHHEVNKGKGCALKTGYRYILEQIPEADGVITADADGQHTVPDCIKLAGELHSGKRALYLGSRDFTLPQVPFKSRNGNKITSVVFWALYGRYLPDTQTGLRAFRREDLPFMIDVSGERFEYEMNVLIACARANIDMVPVTIETVYENDNAGTHFHPIRDSYRIYKVILGNFIKFMGASLASFLIDTGVFALLDGKTVFGMLITAGAATVIARLISAPCNFLFNRNLVFRFKKDVKRTALRYALLALIILCASAGSMALLESLGLPGLLHVPMKIVVDVVLYLLSYRVQNKWVFREEEKQ